MNFITPNPNPNNVPDVNNKQAMAQLAQQHFGDQTVNTVNPPAPTNDKNIIANAIKTYMENNNSPAATQSAQFADQAQRFPITQKYPYLIPAIAMNETTGGKNVTYANNWTNWGIREPSFQPTSPEQVIERTTSGIGERSPYYQDFRNTGDLNKLAAHYAPPGENNTKKYVQDLLDRMAEMKKLENRT